MNVCDREKSGRVDLAECPLGDKAHTDQMIDPVFVVHAGCKGCLVNLINVGPAKKERDMVCCYG